MSTLAITGDIHHTDRDDQEFQFVSSGPRFYSEALTNLQTFIDFAEAEGVDAIVQMGDQVDAPDDGTDKADLLDAVQAILHGTAVPAYNVMGNWELPDGFDDSAEYFTHIKNGTAVYDSEAVEYEDSETNEIRRYYIFEFGNALGIVLDSTGVNRDAFPQEYYKGDADVGLHVMGANYIHTKQRTWLTNILAANTTKPIVIFCHHWLYLAPGTSNPFGFGFVSSDDDLIQAIIEVHQATYGNIVAVIGAHHHPGGQAWWSDKLTTPPSTEGAVFYDAYAPTMEKHNGIKYFRIAAPIRGWGSEAGGVDEAAANVYYKLEVGVFVTDGVFDARLTGYGNNPGGESQEGYSYLCA